MAYGRYKRKSANKYASRSAKYTSSRTSARSKKFATARKSSVKTNARRIVSNARKIAQLNYQQFGRLQRQTTITTPYPVSKNHPLCVHVNNPLTGNAHGPHIWHVNNVGISTASNSAFFQKYEGPGTDYDMGDLDHTYTANGPTLKLRSVNFQLRFHGFVHDCRIRIDVVRRKSVVTDYWNQNHAKQFLPDVLPGFKDLAGFTANRIDTSAYQILKTKHVYINSRGESTFADATDGEPDTTTDPNTAATKHCNVYLKLNQLLKQLKPSVDELTDQDHLGMNTQNTSRAGSGSSWSYDNQHPLRNTWLIISCDDDNGYLDSVTQDSISVEMIRTCVWQDKS